MEAQLPKVREDYSKFSNMVEQERSNPNDQLYYAERTLIAMSNATNDELRELKQKLHHVEQKQKALEQDKTFVANHRCNH